MGGVWDGSMSSLPKTEYLPATENDDGSMGVDLSSLSSSENPDVVSASVNCVARHYKNKNKELQVKVPLEYFKFIHPLIQMGFNRIERAESTYIVLREDKSLQIASSVTLMQSETITSSGNLISSQTPDEALAVQTPSEIACASDWKRVAAGSGDTRVGQGPEFKHSNQAFPSGPLGMGNDDSTGPEIPVKTKKRSHSANKSKRLSTRPRGADYGDKAKGLLLQFRLEYLQDPTNVGKSHKWLMPVTEKMKKNGYDREPDSLRGLWETTKKSRDAIRRAFPEGSTNYWDLTMDQKKAFRRDDPHFPLTFELKWVADMEKIEKMDPRSIAKMETQSDGQEGVFSKSLASTITGSTNFAGTNSSDANIQASVQHFEQASAQGSDKDMLEIPQRLGAPPSSTQDLSFWHSQREKDNQAMSTTMEEQLTELKKLVESSDSLGLLGDADYLKFFS